MQSRPTPSAAPALSLALGTSLAYATLLGCQPSLPSPDDRPSPDPRDEPHALLEPDAPFDAAPRALRVRIVPDEGAITDPARLLFVTGHVGPAHVRQVEDGAISQALSERVLPALTWSDPDGTAVLAPTFPLDPDITYGVLSGDPPLGVDLHITPDDPIPLLDRVWPPASPSTSPQSTSPQSTSSQSTSSQPTSPSPSSPSPSAASAPTTPFAIYCGTSPLAAPPAQLSLSPGDLPATATACAFEDLAPMCLRIDATTPTAITLAVPPPTLTLADNSTIRLDPQPISLSTPPLSAAPPRFPQLACTPDEIPFGPACALVTDDRLLLRSPETPLFWAIRTSLDAPSSTPPPAAADHIRTTAASEHWVLLGLSPSTSVTFDLVAIDPLGRARRSVVHAVTTGPVPHVVISEVLANPLGSEPDQEWVELTNDGLAPALLTDLVLTDIGGETLLPEAILMPGKFALVVNDTFLEDDELDVPPAPGTLILRVPKLGKTGLKNEGESLKLLDPTGAVLSRFPATPKPKPGQSLARISPSAPDGEDTSFAPAPPTPGAPNDFDL